MARVMSESDDFVRLAPFPVTNVSPAADPMPEVSDAASGEANPDWRPKTITDVYTHKGVIKLMAWFEEMRVYELKGVAKKGSGLRRPDDRILDDEYVQPEARGRAWSRLVPAGPRAVSRRRADRAFGGGSAPGARHSSRPSSNARRRVPRQTGA